MAGRELMALPEVGQGMTLEALAAAVDLHPAHVELLVDYGLLEPIGVKDRVLWFHARTVRRLYTIRRLREDLGINLPGIAVVLDLLERIEAMQEDLVASRRGRER